MPVVRYPFRSFDGAAADEDGETPKADLLYGREEIVTPGDSVMHGAEAVRLVAWAIGQERQPRVEPRQQRVW